VTAVLGSTRSSLIVLFAFWVCSCNNPTSPDSRTYFLSGLIRDSASLTPIADATVQVTTGSLAGRMTLSDAAGRFQFADMASAVEQTMVTVLKFGYLPVTVQVDRADVVISLLTSRLPIEGDYTMTFTASDECTMLPSTLRRRAYPATVVAARRFASSTDANFAIELSGSDFFPELRILSLSIRASNARFFVASVEAEQRWGDDLPIYERVDGTGYLSLHGTGTATLTVSDTAFNTTFDGIMSYCPRSTSPFGPGNPPQCSVPAVDCQSDRHQLSGSRRE
jgi:hypothetical protein